MTISKPQAYAFRLAVASFLMLGTLPAGTLAADLSKYRDFKFGTDLPTVAKQAGSDAAQATLIHQRPAVIQELSWRPQLLRSSTEAEAAKEVVFSFFNGKLFRIAIDYDRYQTEGMTADDLVTAISASYGTAAKPGGSRDATPGRYGDQEELLAQWQDSQYRFDLIRSSYGPGFKLVGVTKAVEEPYKAAIVESARLDEKEAPQREVERTAKEGEIARASLEKARQANKPKFRP
jgi:hypothetical protein